MGVVDPRVVVLSHISVNIYIYLFIIWYIAVAGRNKYSFHISVNHFKGRRQNSSVASSDFLQSMNKRWSVRFCSLVTPLPHARLKVTLVDDIKLLFPMYFNVFL